MFLIQYLYTLIYKLIHIIQYISGPGQSSRHSSQFSIIFAITCYEFTNCDELLVVAQIVVTGLCSNSQLDDLGYNWSVIKVLYDLKVFNIMFP